MHSAELTHARFRASRLTPGRRPHPPAPPDTDAALDADLLAMLAQAGGGATLRELFQRDESWLLPAPTWATAAALRCVRAGLMTCSGRAAVFTLTPRGLALAQAGRAA